MTQIPLFRVADWATLGYKIMERVTLAAGANKFPCGLPKNEDNLNFWKEFSHLEQDALHRPIRLSQDFLEFFPFPATTHIKRKNVAIVIHQEQIVDVDPSFVMGVILFLCVDLVKMSNDGILAWLFPIFAIRTETPLNTNRNFFFIFRSSYWKIERGILAIIMVFL